LEYKKVCLQCNKEFITAVACQKFCSKECLKINGINRKREKLRQFNHNFLSEYHPKCVICNKEFKPNTTTQKYCSIECIREIGRRRHIEYNKNNKKINKGYKNKFCKECNREYKPAYSHSFFCSKICYEINCSKKRKKGYIEVVENKIKKNYKKLSELRQCKICKKMFIPKSGIHKYCSVVCIRELQRIQALEYRKNNGDKLRARDREYDRKKFNRPLLIEKECQICENIFIPKNKRQIICSSNVCILKHLVEKKKKDYYENYDEYKKIRVEKYKKDKENKSNYYLALIIRGRLRDALNAKGIKKTQSSIKLLGCSSDEFKKHLENKFKVGMNWSNYGYYGWHIDHIIPCAKFNLKDIEEQKKCFHYTNMQPLWQKENFKKGAR